MVESERMTLLRARRTAAAWDLDGVSADDSAVGSPGTLAEATNPAPKAAMPSQRVRLPFEKAAERSLEPLTCDSLKRSFIVPSESGLDQDQPRWPVSCRCISLNGITRFHSAIFTSLNLGDHHWNGRYERTKAFIVPQRFPKDRPAGEIEYWPTDAGTMKVSA